MRGRPLIALTCGLLLAGCSGRDPVLAAMDADPDWCPSGWPEVEDTYLALDKYIQQCGGGDDITSIQKCVDGSIPKTLGPPSCIGPCDTRKCMD